MADGTGKNRNQDKLIYNKLFLAVAALCLLVAVIWFVRFSYGLYTDKKQAEAGLSEGQELNFASGKTQDGLIELDGKLYRRNTAVPCNPLYWRRYPGGTGILPGIRCGRAGGRTVSCSPGYGQGYGPDSDDTQGYDDGDYTV